MQVDPIEQLLETITEIVPGVFLGNANVAGNQKTYDEHKIIAVLNCSQDLPFHHSQNMYQMRLNIHDSPDSDEKMLKSLPSAVEFIRAHQPILVHCFAGMSRSPTVVAAYLMKYHGHTPVSAAQYILQKRPFCFMYGRSVYYANALNKFYNFNDPNSSQPANSVLRTA